MKPNSRIRNVNIILIKRNVHLIALTNKKYIIHQNIIPTNGCNDTGIINAIVLIVFFLAVQLLSQFGLLTRAATTTSSIIITTTTITTTTAPMRLCVEYSELC